MYGLTLPFATGLPTVAKDGNCKMPDGTIQSFAYLQLGDTCIPMWTALGAAAAVALLMLLGGRR